jgi:shikimate kinase
MGSGKTTVGRALAKELDVPFYDLDWYIEERFHKTVPQIFAEKGEEGFRQMERNMLHEVAEFEDIVLSAGGGTPCFFDNVQYMNEQACTIYLKASPEVLYGHLRVGKTERPLLKGKTEAEMLEYIEATLTKREPFYSQARYTLNVNNLESYPKIKESVRQIREMLRI